MRKIIAILLMVSMLLAVVGCADRNNTPPTISGVKPDYSIKLGEEFNALTGVTASDEQDGDITGKIMVTSVPAIVFTNGKATPTAQGEYEIIYTVADKKGEKAEAFSTLKVGAPVSKEELYLTLDLEEGADGAVDTKGWALAAEEANAVGGVNNGRYEIAVKNPGADTWAVAFKNPSFEVEAGVSYKVKLYASASTKIFYSIVIGGLDVNGSAANVINAELGEKMSVIEYTFSVNTVPAGDVSFNVTLGNSGISNESYTPPTAYKVNIEKIEIFTTKGEDTDGETLFERSTFAAADSALSLDMSTSKYGFVRNVFSAVENGKIKATVNAGGAPHEQMLTLGLGVNANKDKKYKLTVKIESDVALPGVMMGFTYGGIDDATSDNNPYDKRESEKSFDIKAGSNELSITATVAKELAPFGVIFQISGAATAATFHITNLKFIEVVGNQVTDKDIISFMPYHEESKINVFNGTDEDLADGVGGLYADNGNLVYRIDEIGTAASYLNKMWISDVVFEPFAYYRIEITVRATTAIDGTFILYNAATSWDDMTIKALNITTESQTFVINTERQFVLAMAHDMIFEFGGAANVSKAPLNIIFESIRIFSIS